MKTRVIKVFIEKEQALYDELMSAMMEHRQYEGGYVMQYNEDRDSEGRMIGKFMLRETSS
jgi:hypothetical protein